MNKKQLIKLLVLIPLLFVMVGCRKSERVSYNLSRQADDFNITRKITVINVIQGEVLYQVTGKMSIENKSDQASTAFYEGHGYKVVRIPYFVQLTNAVVKELFSVDVKEPLFPSDVPSFNVDLRNTPAFMCPLGIKRCSKELNNLPDQKAVNLSYLKDLSEINTTLSGLDFLE